MPSLIDFHYRFTPTWPISLLTFLGILFFLRLGFWQCTRATEKEQMLAEYRKFAQQKPIVWDPKMAFPKQYQRIKITGHYLPKILLLDNQHHHHQFGYHILSVFAMQKNKFILIDRGWIAGDITRQTLPQCSTPNHFIHLTGSAYFPAEKNWILGQPFEKKTSAITILEQIDPKLLHRILHKSVYPFIIRLDKKEPHGYVRQWEIVAMPPQRHYAYALQWFAMAATSLVLFIGLNLKKINEP